MKDFLNACKWGFIVAGSIVGSVMCVVLVIVGSILIGSNTTPFFGFLFGISFVSFTITVLLRWLHLKGILVD